MKKRRLILRFVASAIALLRNNDKIIDLQGTGVSVVKSLRFGPKQDTALLYTHHQKTIIVDSLPANLRAEEEERLKKKNVSLTLHRTGRAN